jgi:Cft2 family RNA processing exonuclease
VIFTNLTRANEIGANSYLLELEGRRLLLDAGMHPRQDGEMALPNLAPLADHSLDAIVLTHAHQDHVGSLPVIMRRQRDVPVFMTQATAVLSEIMLHNSVSVMTRRAEETSAGAVLFTHREIDQAVKRWRGVPLQQRFDLTGERLGPSGEADVSIELHEAGHILGSVGVLIRAGGRSILYTGDVNFSDQTLMQAARFPEEPIDTLITECTRGDHPTSPDFTRAQEERRFCEAIRERIEGGGSVMIPVFALGKTQETLAMLLDFFETGALREVPIYIGGLSTKLTEAFDRLANTSRRRKYAGRLLDAKSVFTLAGAEGFNAQIRPRRIYAVSSGMMSEHTLSNGLARDVISDPKHGLFFVGYADPESPAGRVRATQPGESVRLSPEFPEQPLRCRREEFSFSGHASRESLRAYIQRVRPKNVVLVHGDPPALEWFKSAIAEDVPGCRVVVPPPGEPVRLE